MLVPRRLHIAILIVVLVTTAALISAQPQSPNSTSSAVAAAPDEGSGGEQMADTPITIGDENTGASITIYESVLNPIRVAHGTYSEIKSFVAPLAIVIVPDQISTLPAEDDDEVMYSLPLLCYPDRIMLQAQRALTQFYSAASSGKFKASSANVSRMTLQLATFELPDFPDARIPPRGDMNSDSRFGASEILNIYLKKKDEKRFETLLKANALQIFLTIYYRSKDVKLSSIVWTADDIRSTDAYNNIKSGGSNFVDAAQVAQIVREVTTRKGVTTLTDPGLPDKVLQAAQDAFKQFLDVEGENKAFVTSRTEASAIETKLLAGTGLKAEQFAPITTMWEITKLIEAADTFGKANEAITSYYNANEQKISGSAGAGFGPFSASVGYSKTTTDIKTGFFKDDDEFKRFRSDHQTEHGMEPRITPRGLGLVERQVFMDNVHLSVSSIAYYPTTQAKRIHISGLPARAAALNRMLPSGVVEVIPIGTVLQWPNLQAPPGWLLCDGAVLDANQHPEYASLADVLGTSFDPAKQVVRLPDFRSRSPMGVGAGRSLTERTLGSYIGEENHSITLDEMPKHKHAGTTGTANPFNLRVVHGAGSSVAINHINGWDGSKGFHDMDKVPAENGNSPGRLHTHPFETDERGGGMPSNVVHPCTIVSFIIKF